MLVQCWKIGSLTIILTRCSVLLQYPKQTVLIPREIKQSCFHAQEEAELMKSYSVTTLRSRLHFNFGKIVVLMTAACFRVAFRRQKSAETAGRDEEDVDELSLIDHKEIMSRITLKQEVRPHCVMCPR